MRRIHSTYLGRTTIPRELTDFEMREFFTLSTADKRAIRDAIRTRLRLPVALQVGFLRMTGTTLDAFDYVPRESPRMPMCSINGGSCTTSLCYWRRVNPAPPLRGRCGNP
jgi:hypothetical protein